MQNENQYTNYLSPLKNQIIYYLIKLTLIFTNENCGCGTQMEWDCHFYQSKWKIDKQLNAVPFLWIHVNVKCMCLHQR